MPPLLAWLATTATAALCPVALLLLRSRRRLAARLSAERLAARETAERALIIQELHEVVAHHVSVMTLGIGAGRMTMDRDATRATDTLKEAEESGRRALTELQRMLGLLSAFTGVPPSRTPQPRLTDLPDLLDDARRGGLRVDFAQDGCPAPLAPGVELSAYRIVQEALSGAVAASSATVTLRWRPGFLEVLVADDGPSKTPASGLRERTALLGGTLLATDGRSVHARLPLG
ncbi:sensor histidine kinase [Nonomuraea africana]|uniref:sensor histidine kinase n=1 Tax=Nonomuraea africana TaxID=46171 RepID=UPI00340D52CA